MRSVVTLYYRGCILYHMLLKALSWQMRQRPALEIIAKRWERLNDMHINAILRFRGMPLVFGQRALQKKLGKYFIQRGVLSREEMEQMIADLNQHNVRFPYATMPDRRTS